MQRLCALAAGFLFAILSVSENATAVTIAASAATVAARATRVGIRLRVMRSKPFVRASTSPQSASSNGFATASNRARMS